MSSVFEALKCAGAAAAFLAMVQVQPALASPETKESPEQELPALSNQNKCDAGSSASNICYIRKGTPVHFSVDDLVTTENRSVKTGDSFRVSLISPVTIDDHVIIPAGTKALGQVDYADYTGAWGHNGSLSVRLLYLDFSGRHIRLASSLFTKGKGGAWAIAPAGVAGVVATGGLLLPISGPLSTGTSAKIKKGQIMSATIDEDVPVDMSSFKR
jgi:hypothetical protein